MKKNSLNIFCFLVIGFLCIASASAISTNLMKSYAPQETVIAEISGNILLPLQYEQVVLKRENVEVPMIYDLKKMGEKYRLWFISPKSVGNYTIWIKGVETTVDGQRTNIDYSQDFSVEGNSSDYYVTPGFVFTSGDFYLQAEFFKDEPMKINWELGDKREVSLSPGTNKIKISLRGIENSGEYTLIFGKYKLPVYVTLNGSQFITLPGEGISFIPPGIQSTWVYPKKETFNVRLGNYDRSTELISLDFNRSRWSILPEGSFTLNPNQTVSLNISLINMSNGSSLIYDEILAASRNFSATLNILLEIIDNRTFGNDTQDYSCAELDGILCGAKQFCEGNKTVSIEGECCLGSCKEQSAGSGPSYAWVGYVLALVAVGIIIFVYFKYYRVKPIKNPVQKKVLDLEHTFGEDRPVIH